MLVLLYESSNPVISGGKLWTVMGPQLRRKEVDRYAL